MTCPFCEREGIYLNKKWRMVKDLYPVSKHHHLVIPSKHTKSFQDLKIDQIEELGEALDLAVFILGNDYGIEEFNIGLNNGVNAGQTIDHVHFHIIPRVAGDVDNPRGGVRGVIPSKKDY